MGANSQNTDLMLALSADASLVARGFTFTCGPTGGVVIDRWSHVRGVWHFHQHNYFWIDAGYNEPSFRTGSLQEAIAHTHAVITKK